MCTILLAHRHYEGLPLVVAANRDEQLDRPAEAPHAWPAAARPLFAPSDRKAGGTWMGVNGSGLFAGITNRFSGGPDPGRLSRDRRSRGLLVLDALACASAREAAATLGRLRGDEHNPFHLVLADVQDALLLWSDGREQRCEELGPGVHAVTERSRGAAPSGREDALVGWLPELDELKPALAVHRENPLDSTCVHAPEHNYGTRSSSFVAFGPEGPLRFEALEGTPCTGSWRDLSEEMAAALRA